MPNRLAKETSPYLQQHADNPVDWYPWGEEALAEAKRSGKPILLSVGYSACHWCHVMAHESFEDAETAKVMNELFVNIKVDREERPDIDQIYQLAQAMLTQRNGGWPLTMFLTPEQLPFFGGTYYPPQSRYGMPGFVDVLRRVREFYDGHRDEMREQGAQVAAALARSTPRSSAHASQIDAAPLDEAADELSQSFDATHGGFGAAPKFPHPDAIELLMRRYARAGDEEALRMALASLRGMALGGIYDQVGGGFARYSVDARWAIPHFEKMLYDNAWLLRLYADAWAITGEPLFERICDETVEWLLREMRSPEGAFHSSLDADSEGEEGKFYVWTPEEVRAPLTAEEFAVASSVFALDQPPNFEQHHWHFVMAREVAGHERALLESARRKLLAARERRVRPGRDDKILTSWNALAIWGLARAARVLGRPAWLAVARDALRFLRTALWKDGRLLATCKDGRAHLDAYLDDHAYLLAALLELLQCEFDGAQLEWAEDIAEILMERFRDPEAGGFFFTAHDHESLIHRPKPGPDNATPSGNGVAAWALNRLSFLTGDVRLSEAAAETIALFWASISRQPSAYGSLLMALEEQLEPPRTVVLTGPSDQQAPWRALLEGAYLPTTMALLIPGAMPGLPPPLSKPAAGQVNAWVCEGVTCLPPIESTGQLRDILELPKITRFAASTPSATGAKPR